MLPISGIFREHIITYNNFLCPSFNLPESDLGLQGSGLGLGLGLDMSSMNLHGQGQGQYSSHPSTGSEWNNQSQSHLRSQRNTFDGKFSYCRISFFYPFLNYS